MKKLRDGTTVETPIEARQAERGPTIFNALLASSGLAVVALTAVYVFFFRA
jgi:tRNA A37 threonylcarbamoyladenosine modification protein TsaB